VHNLHSLEDLKSENRLLQFAENLLACDFMLLLEQKGYLLEFFDSVLSLNPEDRSDDWYDFLIRIKETFRKRESANSSFTGESCSGTFSKPTTNVGDEALHFHPIFKVWCQNRVQFSIPLMNCRLATISIVSLWATTASVRG
jgi:hypothetical protein